MALFRDVPLVTPHLIWTFNKVLRRICDFVARWAASRPKKARSARQEVDL